MRDVSPDPLRERIRTLLDESAMVPGVLALASARAVEGAGRASVAPETSDSDGESRANGTGPTGATVGRTGSEAGRAGSAAGAVGVEERAAGVQLIYEGLRLTRALADDPPWERDSAHTDSNIDILAADVMVARGFSLLARTEAADKAVETVQSFGRDETDDQQGRAVSAHALETDVFELAVVAGTTAFGSDPSDALVAYAGELAESLDGDRPEPPESIAEAVEQAVADAPNPRRFGPAEDPRPSATDP
ncbi:hypothetical protein M0R89_04540 [Halorussus limi]|uniref:Uncharacterized protein n=1 Tax=Halorussus limi TaxID=2938695 RepID=A0A8U0HWN5_9EURY|nr:hypothetical protein [Halorussus limi]UPV75337.1 hypothetical protein M0R89_04540 [Halorussus limi]